MGHERVSISRRSSPCGRAISVGASSDSTEEGAEREAKRASEKEEEFELPLALVWMPRTDVGCAGCFAMVAEESGGSARVE